MDYSLMVAVDESRKELVVGIIDCIRTYTWDKKLESWIKDRGFAGGGRNRPTVTSPKEYKSRFREAMARYVDICALPSPPASTTVADGSTTGISSKLRTAGTSLACLIRSHPRLRAHGSRRRMPGRNRVRDEEQSQRRLATVLGA